MEIKDCKTVTMKDNVHEAVAKVGRDTIEYAKYHEYEHSWRNWLKPIKEKTMMDKIEDFWDYITTPFWKIKRWTRDTYWEVRYGFQRMFKGYDVVDTFETFAKFIERYTKILTEYRKTHVGYVGTMTNEEWEAIIDEMLYHLKYMDEWTVTQELEKDVPDNWSVSSETVYEVMDKHKNEFFKLFSEYFYNLWD